MKIEFERRGLNTSITANPKTVDNEIDIIDSSFGFQTAVEIAQQAIDAAHVEAVSGVGLVKLMGDGVQAISTWKVRVACLSFCIRRGMLSSWLLKDH